MGALLSSKFEDLSILPRITKSFDSSKMMTLQETGRTSFGVSIAMTVLATLAMAGRFLAKWKTGNSIRLEDWLIIFGFSTFIAYVAVLLHGEFPEGIPFPLSPSASISLNDG